MVFSKKKTSRNVSVGSLTYGGHVQPQNEPELANSLYRILQQSGVDLAASGVQQTPASGASSGAGGASHHARGVNTLPTLSSAKKKQRKAAAAAQQDVRHIEQTMTSRDARSPALIGSQSAATATLSSSNTDLTADPLPPVDSSSCLAGLVVTGSAVTTPTDGNSRPSSNVSAGHSGHVMPAEYRHSVHTDTFYGGGGGAGVKMTGTGRQWRSQSAQDGVTPISIRGIVPSVRHVTVNESAEGERRVRARTSGCV